jgi:hypothetical protein
VNHVAADGQVVFEYIGETSGVDRANRDAESKIKQSNANISANMDKHQGNMHAGLKRFAGIATAIGVSAIAAMGTIAAGVGKIVKDGIQTASDLAEVQNVVDTTFGASSDAINDWATKAAKAYGLSELSAKKFNGTMGAMLKSSGLTGDAVAEMSMGLSGLAGDMASFYNLDPTEAFEKIRSGISGETEPLKQLGINMSETNLAAFALAEGLAKPYNKMSEAEKVQVRYNYLMKVSKDAQGDFAKTSGSFANQLKIIKLQYTDIAGKIGKSLLPALTGFTNKGTDMLQGLSDEIEAANGDFGKISEAIGDFFADALVEIGKNAPKIVDGMLNVIQTIIGTLTKPENLSMIAASAADILLSLANGIMDTAGVLLPALLDVITNIVVELSDPRNLADLVNSAVAMLEKISDGLIENIPILLPALIQVITGILLELTKQENIDTLIGAGATLIGAVLTGISQAALELVMALPDIVNNIVDGLAGVGGLGGRAAGDKMAAAGSGLAESFWNGFMQSFVDNCPKFLRSFLELISGVPFNDIYDATVYANFNPPQRPASRGGMGSGYTYATGVTNFRGGLARINDIPGDRFSGEIVRLPRGTDVIPHDVSVEAIENLLSGGARASAVQTIIVQPNNIYLDGKKIATSTNGHNYRGLAVTRAT